MPLLLAAFLLGCVAGLRTFTAPAVLWLMRHTSVLAYLFGVAALAEYVADLLPNTPARTSVGPLVVRIASGAFCAWGLTWSGGGLTIAAAVAGALGAVVGAYGGLALRMRAITLIGRVPAALAEDLIAIVGAILIVAYA
ncbi:MAG TPA: hypothetical protein VMT95_15535 [Candidatus Binatia bacterium]|nr:hypothetical protein [Candidatus Binatia bacterium]